MSLCCCGAVRPQSQGDEPPRAAAAQGRWDCRTPGSRASCPGCACRAPAGRAPRLGDVGTRRTRGGSAVRGEPQGPSAPVLPPPGAVLVSGVYDLEPILHTYVNDALNMSR